jgi:uncharacterized protein (DUF2267 family)
MNEQQLLDEVMVRMGAATHAQARRAIVATLMTLGERLGSEDKLAVAAELPRELADHLLSFVVDPALDLPEFYARVARREGVGKGFAFEHAQAVTRGLSALLSKQARSQLCIDVWPELVRPSLDGSGVRPTVGPPAIAEPALALGRPTLATGRPGSRRPLSEGRPLRRTHRSSVVRSTKTG